MNNENQPANKSPMTALILAFTPSVLVLSLMILGSALNFKSVPVPLLMVMCLASVICCFTSSSMLFQRGTTFAIVGAIILMLLNGFISFGFGCCATLGGRGPIG